MASISVAAGIEMISNDKIARPPTVKTNLAPSATELDAIELPDYGLTKPRPMEPISAPDSAYASEGFGARNVEDVSAAKTTDDLEQSQPPTPQGQDGVDIVPTLWFPKMNRWRVLAACLEYFGNGINDSAPGALIPYVEQWYGIGYAVVSMIWMSNAGESIPFWFDGECVLISLQLGSLSLHSLAITFARSLGERGA